MKRAALPTTPVATAHAIAAHLARLAAGTEPVLGADQVVADLGDGYAALRPAVHLLRTTRRRHHQRRAALPLRLGIRMVTRRRPGSAAEFTGGQRDHRPTTT